MQVDCNRQYCLDLGMDSNDNVTGVSLQSQPANTSMRTWKDFSPPTSMRADSVAMGESGNANTKTLPKFLHKDSEVATSDCLDSGISSVGQGMGTVGNGMGNGMGNGDTTNTMKLEQKVQILEGPVIRMGTGALTTRRDSRSQPDCLPLKAQAATLTTWKDVSPPKEKRQVVELSASGQRCDGVKSDTLSREEKNRNSIRTNPFHEGGGIYRGAEESYQTVKRIKKDGVSADGLSHVAHGNNTFTVTSWRDLSPTKAATDGRRKRPESGYFSNDVQSEGGQESRDDIDTSSSDSDCGRKERTNSTSVPGEEACFHSSDYFYEDEFSVQFDTNLRDAAAGEESAAEEPIILPQSLNGSYTKFGGLRDSVLQTDLYLGPYESELSGSRTSMEISSSEREMMCSSDMLNFSNDPLFTPTPPPVEHQQNLSVDSLSHQGQGCEADMANSRSSNDANLGVDCCIRKDAYFLSFSGSQEHRSTSESEISCVSQTSSQDGQREGSRTDSCYTEDAEDECSNSFQFQEDRQSQKVDHNPDPPTVHYRPVRNMLLSRYPGRICLEALQEYLLDRSHSTKSPGSSRHSCSSNCKLSPLCGTLLSSGDLCLSGGVRRGLRRSSNLTTWKQVKNLRKYGKEQNLHERSRSLPDLTADDVKVVRRERPSRTVESMADSFHNKRHSAYILELYQQLLAGSNPPSPTTLGRIDQILFQEHVLSADNTRHESRPSHTDSCHACGARNRGNLRLDFQRDAQCGRSQSTAGTEVSPHTLTLWYGQKNFSSQFPPNTADCGVQTSVREEEGPSLNHRSMQTSPASPGTDLFHMLNQLQARESREARNGQEEKEAATVEDTQGGCEVRPCVESREHNAMREGRHQRREKGPMTRAKSATECRDTHVERLKSQMRRTVSLSPSRMGMNSFYTHQSLPDLSFLSTSSRPLSKSRDTASSAASLFDPVQIPIILTPVVEDAARSSQSHSRCSAPDRCGCGKDNVRSSLQTRQRRRLSGARSGDLTSSGSNYSLSSSSGIDPGYVDTRSHTCLVPELEHLLFLPPHLESAYHQLGLPETAEPGGDCVCCSQDRSQHGGQPANSATSGPGNNKGRVPGTADSNRNSPPRQTSAIHHKSPVALTARMDRYSNETYPDINYMQNIRAAKDGRRGSNCSSSGSVTHDRLCALREEKTPSPEPAYCHYPARDYRDYRCFGCHSGSEGDSSQELDEEKLEMYQQWLQERKPPLKSCLRKRYDRDQRARSLSLVTYETTREEPPEKPPRRPNRHSIACDGMFPVLVDEEGFVCEGNNVAPQRPPQPAHLAPDFTADKVVLRRKKKDTPHSEATAEDASQDEINRAKRVSFASEVSFHSPNYTPQSSPHRQPTQPQGEVAAVEMEDDVLTLHVVRRGKTLHMPPGGQHAGDTISGTTPPALTRHDAATELSAQPGDGGCVIESPWEQKAYTLVGVIQAAEALVRHFAQARDPFDKVRLGSAQETPEVGAMVVTSLCPAIERVVRDGMKPYLTGLHIFGKVHLSSWRMAESSAEIGPYTRAINDLVKQLKTCPQLVSHRQKFYAFLAGLLNLRLLDFWMGYISRKESIVERFYEDDAILRLSRSRLERNYEDVLLALQPLAVLPFQIDYDIVANYSLADSAYMGESDFDPSSPKKSELSSSPKVVIARTKTGTSPDRASWCGASDRADSSLTRSGLDFSATWDWIKTTTLPKARSLMSDMGLVSSNNMAADTQEGREAAAGWKTEEGEASQTSCPAAKPTGEEGQVIPPDAKSTSAVVRRVGVSRGAKTSRLSQDLASVGIVASRGSLSTSTPTHSDTASAATDTTGAATDTASAATSAATDTSSAATEMAIVACEKLAPAPADDQLGTPHTKVVGMVTPQAEVINKVTPESNVTKPTAAEEKGDSSTGNTSQSESHVTSGDTTQPMIEGSSRDTTQTVSDVQSDRNSVVRDEHQSLPAVVVDHGARQQTARSARQRAEEILRRKGDSCSLKKRDGSPLAQQTHPPVSHNSPQPHPPVSHNSPQPHPPVSHNSPKTHPLVPGEVEKQDLTGDQTTGEIVTQEKQQVVSVDVKVTNCPARDTAHQPPPLPHSPSRGPQQNTTSSTAGSPTSRTGSTTSTAASPSSKAETTSSTAAATSSTATTSSTAATTSSTVTTTSSTVATTSPTAATTSSTVATTSSTAATTSLTATTSSSTAASKGSSVGGKLSGLRKLSPKGSFNIISFFDRLLLPSERGGAAAAATTTKSDSDSDASSPDQAAAVSTTTTPTSQPPPSVAAVGTTQSRKGSRIPKAQSRSETSKSTSEPARSKSGKNTGKTSKTSRSSAIPTTKGDHQSTRGATVTSRPASSSSVEFDINANSADVHHQNSQQPVLVEHNPVAVSQSDASDTSATNVSHNSRDSVSMEEEQERTNKTAGVVTSRGNGP